MIDKKLLRLLGDHKKYIFYTVALMVLGLLANLSITASICWAIALVLEDSAAGGAMAFLRPGAWALAGVAVRYVSTRLVVR